MLGIASTARDWGLFPSKEVTMDASAGIAMGNRRGLGRAKHVDSKERVSSQETRHRPNVGRRADESCHRGENDYSHERHELPLLGR